MGRLGRFAGPKHPMSLDVYLRMPGVRKVLAGTGVFVRENGATVELTPEQVREKFPNAEFVVAERDADDVAFHANITHNLGEMAEAAGLYRALWRPEENGLTKARDLRVALRRGLHTLLTEPDRLKKLNPKNGWGDYDGLVRFVREYLDACIEYPDADVEVSR